MNILDWVLIAALLIVIFNRKPPTPSAPAHITD